jgi:hypothetical protein
LTEAHRVENVAITSVKRFFANAFNTQDDSMSRCNVEICRILAVALRRFDATSEVAFLETLTSELRSARCQQCGYGSSCPVWRAKGLARSLAV